MKQKMPIKFRKKLYVDNLFTGTNTTQEAEEIFEENRSVLLEANMNLREWAFNDKNFMQQLPEELRLKENESSGYFMEYQRRYAQF